MLHRTNDALQQLTREIREIMNTAKENLEFVKTLSENSYEASRQLSAINMRTAENLFAQQMEAFGLWMGSSIKQVELVANARDYQSLLSNQTDVAKAFSESLKTTGQNAMEVAGEAREEYRAWYKGSVETFSHKAEEASVSAPKKAATKRRAKKS